MNEGMAIIGDHQAVWLSSKLFASLSATMENVVDELKAQFDENSQLVENVEPVASGGSGVLTTLIIIGIVGLVMIGAVILWSRRRSSESSSEDADYPLFEDQYAVHDDEISIETQPAGYTAEEHDHQDDDEAIISVMADETETIDLISDDEEEPEPTLEPEAEEPVAAAEPETEAEVETEVPYTEHRENVIPLMKRGEEKTQTPEPQSQPHAPHDPEEELTADADAVEPEQEDTPQEEEVRYAFASRQQGPMAFSSITSDETAGKDTEEEPKAETPEEPQEDNYTYRPRSYIAPTVLREDFSRLERLQGERLEILRDEITRQLTTLKSDQNNRFDIVVDALDRKLNKMGEMRFEAPDSSDGSIAPALNEFSRQINLLQSTLDNQSQRIRAITQILDDRLGTVSHVYGEVRTIGDKIDRFTHKLDDMDKAIAENTRTDIMADVQLSDVVRSSLSPDAYEFKPLLSNNHRADCLIRLPHPPGTIVIDTRFPVDAYNALPTPEDVRVDMHQARTAEDAFRRSVLRHIIDVSERFIIPGETADSVLMFVPTETIYTTLHSRFPDLIRDAFRARVWIVSPSTLMGTLQTLRGVMETSSRTSQQEAARKAEEENELRTEMERLRERASSLARNFETTQSELREILEATDRVFSQKPEKDSAAHRTNGNRRDSLVRELYDRQAEWPDKSRSPYEEEKRSSSLYEEFSRRPDPLR